MTLMPALFIGHGSPMNTLERNGYTEAWRALGRQLPRPRALLVVSAHWFIGATAVTAMARPRTIHDFYGFPPELFAFQYPAPGAPDLAEEVVELRQAALARARPGPMGDRPWRVERARPPLSGRRRAGGAAVDQRAEAARLSSRARRLPRAAARARRSDPRQRQCRPQSAAASHWSQRDAGADWAHRFDDAAAALLADATRPTILRLVEHPDYALAVPTPGSFHPACSIWPGSRAEGKARPRPLIRGYAFGSLSMTCYGLGADAELPAAGGQAASLPADVPPDQTNI